MDDNGSWNEYYKQINIVSQDEIDVTSFSKPFVYTDVNYDIWKVYERLKIFNKRTTFLEVGCGPGAIGLKVGVKKLFKKVVLLDFSETIERYVNDVISILKISNVSFKRENAISYNLGKQFDVVYAGGLLDHFSGKEIEDVIDNNIKHLKENGIIISVEPLETYFNNLVSQLSHITEENISIRPFKFNEIKEHLENRGVEIIYHQKATPYLKLHVIKNLLFPNPFTVVPIFPNVLLYLFTLILYRITCGN